MTDAAIDQSVAVNPVPRTRYFHWLILGLFLLLGLQLRLRDIDKPSLWFDEFFTMFLSTGRGQRADSPLTKPAGVVMAPFATGFTGAPPWWKVWTGMASTFHPPVYYIVLRWWVDMFGDGDRAMRLLSVVFSLAAVVVLFDVVRRTRGPWAGLCAAGLMSAAWAQIIMGQELRSYTMLLFLGLLLARTMVMIQMRGPRTSRLVLLGILAAGMMLTHYLAAGALAGMGLYALIAWRGRMRWGAIVAMLIAGAMVPAVWLPGFSGTYQQVLSDAYFMVEKGNPIVESAKYLLTVPANLTVSPIYTPAAGQQQYHVDWLLAGGVFVLAMVLPITQFRRSPDALLWWLWVAGSLALPLMVDLTHPYAMLGYPRYVFLASPGLIVLVASPLPALKRAHWAGWLVPVMLVACCILGTETSAPAAPWKQDDWRSMARSLQKVAGPNDVLVIWKSYQFLPGSTYVVLNHYGDFSRQRVVYLSDDPLPPQALRELADAPAVWVVGLDPAATMARCFPGWTSSPPINSDGVDCIWKANAPARK